VLIFGLGKPLPDGSNGDDKMPPDKGAKKSVGLFDRKNELCFALGQAIVAWQDVEDAHFRLFFRMLGATNTDIAAIVYYNTESFDGRRRMVDNMVKVVLTKKEYKALRSAWANDRGGLQKEIRVANDNRNKLAHYSLETDTTATMDRETEIVEVRISSPRLRPSVYNIVSHLLGRTPDQPAHNLGVNEVRSFAAEFRSLAKRMSAFHDQLPVPTDPNPTLRQLGLPPRHLVNRRHSNKT
jgi:hypothetical protein